MGWDHLTVRSKVSCARAPSRNSPAACAWSQVADDRFQKWPAGSKDRTELQACGADRLDDGVEGLLELRADGPVAAELPCGEGENRLEAVTPRAVDRAGQGVVVGEEQADVGLGDAPHRCECSFPQVVQAGGEVAVIVCQRPGEVENGFLPVFSIIGFARVVVGFLPCACRRLCPGRRRVRRGLGARCRLLAR